MGLQEWNPKPGARDHQGRGESREGAFRRSPGVLMPLWVAPSLSTCWSWAAWGVKGVAGVGPVSAFARPFSSIIRTLSDGDWRATPLLASDGKDRQVQGWLGCEAEWHLANAT